MGFIPYPTASVADVPEKVTIFDANLKIFIFDTNLSSIVIFLLNVIGCDF